MVQNHRCPNSSPACRGGGPPSGGGGVCRRHAYIRVQIDRPIFVDGKKGAHGVLHEVVVDFHGIIAMAECYRCPWVIPKEVHKDSIESPEIREFLFAPESNTTGEPADLCGAFDTPNLVRTLSHRSNRKGCRGARRMIRESILHPLKR